MEQRKTIKKPLKPLRIISVKGTLNLLEVEHVIGTNSRPTHAEVLERKYVHGLVPSPHIHRSRTKIYKLLRELIMKVCPLEIVFWDDTLTDFIPSVQSRKIRIKCPHWNHRMAHYSHQAALSFKLGNIDLHFHTEKSGHNHSRYEGLQDSPVTMGDFIKQNYGYQCALVKAYELMHYYMASPTTKINFL